MLPLIAAGVAAAAPLIAKGIDALTGKPRQDLPKVNPYQGQQLGFSDAYNQAWQNQQQARDQQMAFLAALEQQTQGRGPAADLANAQFQGNLNQANAATASQIASARGLSPAAAIRLAAQQNAMANQAGVVNAQANRLQGQLAAQGMLGGALSGVRGQDLSGASMGQQGALTQNAQNAANYYTAAELNQRAAMANNAQDADERKALMGGIGGAAGGFAQLLAMQPGAAAASQSAIQSTMANPALSGSLSMPSSALGGGSGYNLNYNRGYAHGGRVEVDSRSDDRVPAMLQEGETVVPASLQGQDKQDFLEAYDAMQSGRHPGRPVSPDAFLKALAARDATIERRIQRLEELIMRGGR